MTSLLPINATPLERATEHATQRMVDLDVPISDVWDASRCPAALLPWLAWALSVDAWDTAWSESRKRQALVLAGEVKRIKGTEKSVSDVVSSFGADIALTEYFADDPYRFDLRLVPRAGIPTDAQYQEQIIATVDKVIPERCHFDLSLGINLSERVGVVVAVRVVHYTRMEFFA